MNNSTILGEEEALRQIISDDYSATGGYFEDDSIITLRDFGFRMANGLKKINLPSATSLGGNSFRGCEYLEEADFPLVTTVGSDSIFSGCVRLRNINLPKLETAVNSGNYLFSTANRLPKLRLPKYRGRMGTGFVSSAILLNILDVNTPDRINASALGGNNSMVAFVLRNSTVCTLDNVNAFSNTKYATDGSGNAYVYVPSDLISSYQSASNWSTLYAAHPNMFRALEDYTVDGTVTGAINESLVYSAKTPVYTLTNQVFDGSTYIDTNLALMNSADEAYAIVVDFTLGDELVSNNTRMFDMLNSSNYGWYWGKDNTANTRFRSYFRPPSITNSSAYTDMELGNRYKAFFISTGKNMWVAVYDLSGYLITDSLGGTNGSISQDSTTLIIGAKRNGNTIGDYWKGTIHSLKIYNDVITEKEALTDLGLIGGQS